LPESPRTPVHPLGDGRDVSGPSPALADGRFAPDEAPSFDRRLTPVVPASWPETESGSNATPMSPSIAPITDGGVSNERGPERSATPEHDATRPIPDGPTMATTSSGPAVAMTEAGEATAVTPSQRKISISLAPSPASEHSFFETPPKYSVPPPSFLSEPPRPTPSRARSLTTKLLFVVALCAAITLLCYEVSIAYQVPWLDPRWLIAQIRFG
jgi:hypothetical protein